MCTQIFVLQLLTPLKNIFLFILVVPPTFVTVEGQGRCQKLDTSLASLPASDTSSVMQPLLQYLCYLSFSKQLNMTAILEARLFPNTYTHRQT